jgi:hypothetical protein
VDPVLPRLIGSGGHHTTTVTGKAADNDRLAPVFRMIELFDRGVKGIQVGMDIIHIERNLAKAVTTGDAGYPHTNTNPRTGQFTF